MNVNTSFGVDFINIMLNMVGQSKESLGISNTFALNVIKLFLQDQGLPYDEVNESSDLLRKQIDKIELSESVVCVLPYVKYDQETKKRLIKQMAAIATLDLDLTGEEKSFLATFRELLDLQTSEWRASMIQGIGLAKALVDFGDVYKKVG